MAVQQNRRDFLKTSTLAALGASALGGADDSPGAEMPVVGVAGSTDPTLSRPAALTATLDYGQVRAVVWLALDRDVSDRSLRNIVQKNSWVVLKPNIVTANIRTMKDFDAEGVLHWGLVTDLRVMKAVAEYLIEKVGPRRITFAEGGVWPSRTGQYPLDGWNCTFEAFDNLSFEGIVNELNARQSGTKLDIVELETDEGVYVTDLDPRGSGIKSFQDVAPGKPDGTSKDTWSKRQGYYIAKTALDCDVLVSIPAMKTHSSAGVTLSLKNLMGCLHNQSYGIKRSKAPVHQGSQLGLLRGICDLVCAIQPDYAVIEGFWATEHQHLGQNGVNCHHNVVVAGGDLVAADAVAQMAMGFNPLDSELLRMMHRKNMGEWNPGSITIAGPPVQSLTRNFVRAANTYSARGIRKWLLAGPLEKPVENLRDITPVSGQPLGSGQWTLLDGDELIDAGINSTPPFLYQECLLYSVPGSGKAREGAAFYLGVKINTPRRDLCGQLLVGVQGGDVRAFFNGRPFEVKREPYPYNPTPMPFLKFREGENLLVLELVKGKGEGIRVAATVCDLDGDKLSDITMDPQGE
ncbi:MAG: DUF362 domain-containing protein [Candidatus Latescibacterota bacterium]